MCKINKKKQIPRRSGTQGQNSYRIRYASNYLQRYLSYNRVALGAKTRTIKFPFLPTN